MWRAAPLETNSVATQETEKGLPKQAAELAKLLLPSSLVVAFLFYYGWARTSALYWQFGLTTEILQFSTVDYLVRSVDFVFRSAFVCLLLLLGLTLIFHTTSCWFRDPRHAVLKAWIARTGFAAGLVGCCIFSASVYFRGDKGYMQSFREAVSLIVSLLLLCYALLLVSHVDPRMKNWVDRLGGLNVMARCIFFGLITVLVFVASGYYAKESGLQQADFLDKNRHKLPSLTIYSAKNLAFPKSDIKLEELTNEASRFRYRYSRVKLLVRAGDHYFVFPERRSLRKGVIMLRETDDLRFEFQPDSTP